MMVKYLVTLLKGGIQTKMETPEQYVKSVQNYQ